MTRRRTDDQRSPPEASPKLLVEAMLLDIDGTLLDSNDAHAQAWSDALREAGYEIGSEVVRPLVGMGSDKLLPKLTGLNAEEGEGKRLVERRTDIFLKQYLPSVRSFPKALELLDRMRADGLRLVVATSASDDELHDLLAALGAEWLAEEATSSSDAERSKPDPDIVRVAIDKAGVGAAHCVMLGDSPYDVEASTRAGVPMIGLRGGGWGDEELNGVAEIYEDPADLLAHYDESLIGKGVRRGSGAESDERRGSQARADRVRRSGEEGPHADRR